MIAYQPIRFISTDVLWVRPITDRDAAAFRDGTFPPLSGLYPLPALGPVSCTAWRDRREQKMFI
jgi:hypothetical protein